MKRVSLGIVAVSAMLSTTAIANADGQFGFTGRDRSCLNCHGSEQYDGLSVALSPAPAETIDCMIKVADAQYELRQIPKLAAGAQHTVTVTLPGGGQQPACPIDDCCEGAPADGAMCGAEGFSVDGLPVEPGTCVPFLDTCGDAIAGFNAEAFGGGIFAVATAGACDAAGACGDGYICVDSNDDGRYDASDTCEDAATKAIQVVNRGLCSTDGACPAEFECVDGNADGELNAQDNCIHSAVVAGGEAPIQITQRQGARFNGGDITWSASYTAPASGAVTMYVGANVANGNGKADGLDLNSNYKLNLVVGDANPEYCAVCSDGSLPDETGACAGCSSMKVPAGSFPASMAAFLGLAGLALVRRRRD